jgi:hypothetical protein
LTVKHFQGQPRWPLVVGQMLWGLVALRHLRGASYLRGKILGWEASRALDGRKQSVSENRISTLVSAGENQIFALQQQTGFDWYWRAYFWLLPRSS